MEAAPVAQPAQSGPPSVPPPAESMPLWDLRLMEGDSDIDLCTLMAVMDALQQLYLQVHCMSLQEVRNELARIDCLLQQALFPL